MSQFICRNGEIFFQDQYIIQQQHVPEEANFIFQLEIQNDKKQVKQPEITGSEQKQQHHMSKQRDFPKQVQEIQDQQVLDIQNDLKSYKKCEDQPEKKQQKQLQSQTNYKLDFKSVFIEKQIRPKKNHNIAKHLMKSVIVNFKNDGQKQFEEQGNKTLITQMRNFVTKEKKMYQYDKNWNNNLQSMVKIFGHNISSKNSRRRSFLTRKMSHRMIRDLIIPKALKNRQINAIYQYMLSLKVFRLRTRNVDLVSRTRCY